jgi:hypothetical protein
LKRQIRIKLSLKKQGDKQVIEHEFEDRTLEQLFNEMDRKRFFKHIRPEQLASQSNRKKRHEDKEPLNEGDRISADDYKAEPDDIHAGIHLRFKEEDEIIFTTDDKINYVVDVGLDPELVRLLAPLPPKQTLLMEDLLSERNPENNPFDRRFPDFCTKGLDLNTGPLKKHQMVRAQQFYKYQVTVLGTNIVLDPHIEGHEDPE